MVFSDDDLKRLKENGPEWELSYGKLEALLARLEAAEAVCEALKEHLFNDQCCSSTHGAVVFKAWRKAAGK